MSTPSKSNKLNTGKLVKELSRSTIGTIRPNQVIEDKRKKIAGREVSKDILEGQKESESSDSKKQH